MRFHPTTLIGSSALVMTFWALDAGFADAQVVREFYNDSLEPIELLKGTTVVETIPPQNGKKITVNIGDRFTVRVKNNPLVGVPPIYINSTSVRTINLTPQQPYGKFVDIRKLPALSFQQNLFGVDMLEYNPANVSDSFKSGKIFQGLTQQSLDHKIQDNRHLVKGFHFPGGNNAGKGVDDATTIIGLDNFQKRFSVGVKTNIPLKPGVANAGLDFAYNESQQKNLKTTDIFFTSYRELNSYNVDLLDPRDAILERGFINEVAAVNTLADAERLIAKYGTHYPTKVIYGGYFKAYQAISEQDYYSAESKGFDLKADVKIQKPGKTEKTTSANGNTQTTTPKPGGSGSGEFSVAQSEKKEIQDLFRSDKRNHYFRGGSGNFDTWQVTQHKDEVATSAEFELLSELIYPDIIKNELTETELKPKRDFIRQAILARLKNLKTIQKQAVRRGIKYQVSEIRLVDHSDDLNRNVKGELGVRLLSGGKLLSDGVVWHKPNFSNEIQANDLFKLDDKRPWIPVIQQGDEKGTFPKLELQLLGTITEQDDLINDDDTLTITGVSKYDISKLTGLEEYEFTLKHLHPTFGISQRFEVRVKVQVKPVLGFNDLNRNVANASQPSTPTSSLLKSGNHFLGNETWTKVPYYGKHGTFFADVTADGKADAIVVNEGGVTVRPSTGSGFGPNQSWNATGDLFYSNRNVDACAILSESERRSGNCIRKKAIPLDSVKSFFLNTQGDAKLDHIFWSPNAIAVGRNHGRVFLRPFEWFNGKFAGDRGTFFADVSGDGYADAIAVNNTGVFVRLSSGNRGFNSPVNWTQVPYYGDTQTSFADVTGDGKADAIVINKGGITVRRSTGSGFSGNETWTNNPYYGSLGTFFADVTGDGKADAIVVNKSGVVVRRSTGTAFSSTYEEWTDNPYYGSRGTHFADVTGDGKADAIVVNDGGITVRRAK